MAKKSLKGDREGEKEKERGREENEMKMVVKEKIKNHSCQMDIHNKNVRVGDKRKPDEKLHALCQRQRFADL